MSELVKPDMEEISFNVIGDLFSFNKNDEEDDHDEDDNEDLV